MAEGNSSKKTEVETVKMTDGRAVDFPGKKRMDKSPLEDGRLGIRIDFRNGQTRDFPMNLDLKDRFAVHGMEQKYGDETAGLEDIDDMIEAVDELHDRLFNAGDWSTKREASGFAGTSILLKALVEVTGRTVEYVRTWLKDKSQAQKMALRLDDKVRPVVERLEKEKASGGKEPIDTKALLGTMRSEERSVG